MHIQEQIPTKESPGSQWMKSPLTRTNVINSIRQRFGYRSYLEIGCWNDCNFSQIDAEIKVGVDPKQGGTHRMTSDDFFKTNRQQFDLVFVDGLHLEEQVLRDVENSLQVLTKGGCILIHDCLPGEEIHQARKCSTSIWMGDVWKAVVKLRARQDVDTAVLNRCCGMGAMFHRPNSHSLDAIPELNWETFAVKKQELLRVLEPLAFERFLSGEPVAS